MLTSKCQHLQRHQSTGRGRRGGGQGGGGTGSQGAWVGSSKEAVLHHTAAVAAAPHAECPHFSLTHRLVWHAKVFRHLAAACAAHGVCILPLQECMQHRHLLLGDAAAVGICPLKRDLQVQGHGGGVVRRGAMEWRGVRHRTGASSSSPGMRNLATRGRATPRPVPAQHASSAARPYLGGSVKGEARPQRIAGRGGSPEGAVPADQELQV
jgi:hypothetical protein